LKIIKHRVNTIDELIATPTHMGVEIDIRTYGTRLVISHDPFDPGTSFSKWIEHYNHNFLIINVKEDGLETSVLNLLNEYKIKDFFFLDQSFPTLFKFSKIFSEFCCARVSDIESFETVLKLKVGWVWFDSHTGDWSYLREAFKQLANMNVNKCLVSPELQRSNFESELLVLKRLIVSLPVNFDAVCTKYPKQWELII